MKKFSKLFAPVLLATGLTVWWPVWCAQKETADQVNNALTTQVDNDKERQVAMQNKTYNILNIPWSEINKALDGIPQKFLPLLKELTLVQKYIIVTSENWIKRTKTWEYDDFSFLETTIKEAKGVFEVLQWFTPEQQTIIVTSENWIKRTKSWEYDDFSFLETTIKEAKGVFEVLQWFTPEQQTIIVTSENWIKRTKSWEYDDFSFLESIIKKYKEIFDLLAGNNNLINKLTGENIIIPKNELRRYWIYEDLESATIKVPSYTNFMNGNLDYYDLDYIIGVLEDESWWKN